MTETLALLGVIAFVSGLIDAAVGGGGLIQIPGLFNVLPQTTVPATVFGTNKFSSICGTAIASRQFVRRVRLPWALVLPAAACAFAFAFVGATAVSLIPKEALKPAILALLIAMAGYTFMKKDFGHLHKPKAVTRRERWMAAGLGAAIGFYDGLFGPGTGSFLAFLFIRCFAFDFLHAAASAKIVNLATNLASLAFFIPAGHILWWAALPMAACNMAGGLVGARLAIHGGVKLIRVLFLILSVVLIGKFGADLLLA
ncbi:sulfite exporter TauE/SafE family protein [Crenobacter cavernae]|uniref:Probable membrane transporter protein n=1 Tax=Crenobacter cavernae TaxID=2290923 RepID=A0A345Y513_9NEIS|nr:TSUP family transporter [Crenobacter cavernae]AXK39015.1 sulfite exporter TauE/SafE family protein [Crenobacter cavernae]